MFREYVPEYKIPQVSASLSLISFVEDFVSIRLAINGIYTAANTGRQYRLIEVIDPTHLIMQQLDTKVLSMESVHTFMDEDYSVKSTSRDFLGYADESKFEFIGDDKWMDMYKRYIAILPMLRVQGMRILNDRVDETGIPKEMLQHWIERFTDENQITALLDRQRQWHPVRSGLHYKNIYRVNDAVLNFYLTRDRPTVEATVREVRKSCHEQKVNPPSDASVRAIIAKLPDVVVMQRRGLKGLRKPITTPTIGVIPKSYVEKDDGLDYFEDIG